MWADRDALDDVGEQVLGLLEDFGAGVSLGVVSELVNGGCVSLGVGVEVVYVGCAIGDAARGGDEAFQGVWCDEPPGKLCKYFVLQLLGVKSRCWARRGRVAGSSGALVGG